jgi:hypothetical protein
MSYLMQGDKMYLQTLNDGFVVLEPGVEFLSVDNLPKFVSVSSCIRTCFLITVHAKTTTTPVNPFDTQNNDTINSLPMVVGQNNSILPIVVEPIEAKNILDLPIDHCGRAHAFKAKTIDLPIVVEPH